MSKTISLRLYFHHAAKAHTGRGWRRLLSPNLARHLMAHASKAGIEQAILHKVHAGYLRGGALRHHHVEASHRHLPHCIELIDLESRLRQFVANHVAHLKDVKAVFLPCEVHETQATTD